MASARVVIVDPYSSGAMLAESLRARHVSCLAIESSPDLPLAMRSKFQPDHFESVLQHDGDPDNCLAHVRKFHPTHVIAGFESGVELAEWLSQQLRLPTNRASLSESRRDKFVMGETVRRAGLRVAQQYHSADVDAILAWIDNSLSWPVVIKPMRSVASDGVMLCTTPNDVCVAADMILANPSLLGSPNCSVLVQEFLVGTEYVVDLVSLGDRRKVTAFWKYSRETGELGYDTMTLIPYDGQRQEMLRAYAFRVLDALGVNFGPSHCEIMWTDHEPVLIEVGSRLSAGNNAILSRICGGICQLDETIEVILDPERFLANLDVRPLLQRIGCNRFLMSHRAGKLVTTRGLEVIESLPTLHSMSAVREPGESVGRVGGRVTLIGENAAVIDADLRRIRELERKGFFEVEEDHSP